jgi:hypothetical protein
MDYFAPLAMTISEGAHSRGPLARNDGFKTPFSWLFENRQSFEIINGRISYSALRESMKSQQPSFLGPGRMDNLLKAHT